MENEIEPRKTRKDAFIQYWNGHLVESIRLEILIGFLKEVDPKRIMKQERKEMGGMPVLNDVTAEKEMEDYKKQLADQKIYLKVIQTELDKEEKNEREARLKNKEDV